MKMSVKFCKWTPFNIDVGYRHGGYTLTPK